MPDTVLVTGGTGFVAQHCAVALLDAGYDVRVTVRDTAREPEVFAALANAVDAAALGRRVEVVEADLTADAGWARAATACRYVLHVASPVPLVMPRDPEDVIAPARDGTRRVLAAARDAGAERVVVTSSIAAVGVGRARDHVVTEADWSNLSSTHADAYAQAKTLAERAAWEFADALGPDAPMSVTTICPGLVLGPLLGARWSPSGEAVRRMMTGSIPGIPDLVYAPVDVRDVAAAHVAAMTSPRAAGQRYLCAAEAAPLRDVAVILAARYRAEGYRIATRRLPTVALRAAALVDRDLRIALHEVGRPFLVDAGKIRRELAVTFRALEEMTLAMAETMIAFGVVRPRPRRRSSLARPWGPGAA